jgi:hypothetical protein
MDVNEETKQSSVIIKYFIFYIFRVSILIDHSRLRSVMPYYETK